MTLNGAIVLGEDKRLGSVTRESLRMSSSSGAIRLPGQRKSET
jgi:hypothetical protein